MACKMPDDAKLSDEERLIKGAVTAFSLKMFKAMKENIHKHGWNNTDYLNHFILELEKCVWKMKSRSPEACINIANYAMMIHKCLKARLRRSGTLRSEQLTVTIGRRHRT